MQKGSPVNRINKDGLNAMMLIITNASMDTPNKMQSAKALIQADIDVNWKNFDGVPVLFFAIKFCEPEISLLLMDQGATPF